jgi:hypothetical protein
MQTDDRYLQPHQARVRPATLYEDLLGDAIERAFASGVQELPDLVAHLNRSGLSAPDGKPWSEATYAQQVSALGL